MTSWKTTVTSAVALGIFSSGTAAFADVTAEDVWADWQDYMTSAGYTMDATETRSGGTISITDLSMTLEIPEEDTTVTVSMGGMDISDNGDGTVSISVAPNLPLDISVAGPEGEEADIGLNYATTALAMNVSGNPDNLTYTYSAAMLGLSLESLVVEGEAVNMADFGTAEINIANVAGSTQMTVGNLRSSVQRLTSGAINYLMDIRDPDGGDGRFVVRGGADSMDFSGTFDMPSEMDTSNMSAMLKAGFAVEGEFAYQNGSSEFNFQEHGDVVQGSSSTSSGALGVVMDDTQLAYALSATDMEMMMAGGDIPFPVEISMAEVGFELQMPVSAGEDEQDFAFGVTFGDFTMSDLIWGIFDPAGQLPRDPATIAMDMSGKVKLLMDLLDPEDMEAMETGMAMPGEINSLDLHNLTVSAAGAKLTGDGAFTFDNTDLMTFDGIPAPTGEVNLSLAGGNGLLDKLVAMGFVPEDQAMGTRMMMGMFAVPGDGEDTLNSKIEVKGDGQILANGQRIK